MDINLVIGIVGLVLAIVGSYSAWKSKKVKKIVYEHMQPIIVNDFLKGQDLYSLKVVYEDEGSEPIYVEDAYASYIRFSNLGNEPITRDDIAKKDRFRLELFGSDILTISLLEVTRDSCGIELGKIEDNEDHISINIDFEFLDKSDGGLIQILSKNDKYLAKVKGTIIGMPKGIQETKSTPSVQKTSGLGCGIMIFIYITSLYYISELYEFITGSLGGVWIMILPVISMFIILFGAMGVLLVFGKKGKVDFPKQLLAPDWYGMRKYMEFRFQQNNNEQRE